MRVCSKRRVDRTCIKILRELNYPPIFLISEEQFAHVEGVKLEKGYDGLAAGKYPVFTIRKGLRGKLKENVLYHEIFHILFPSWEHWRIECAAERMAGGGGRGYYSKKYGHTVDEMPSRAHLLKLARRAAERLKRD